MWVAYIIVTVGSTNKANCLTLGVASMRASEGDSIRRQATTPLKPGGGVTLGRGSGDPGDDSEPNLSCSACLHSSALWCRCLLPSTLWQQCLHLSSLGGRGISPAEITDWAGCSTSVQPGKSLWGTSPFPLSSCHTGEYPTLLLACLSGLLCRGHLIVGSSVGGASSVGSSIGAISSVGTLAGASSSMGAASSVGTSAGASSSMGLPPQWEPLWGPSHWWAPL